MDLLYVLKLVQLYAIKNGKNWDFILIRDTIKNLSCDFNSAEKCAEDIIKVLYNPTNASTSGYTPEV